MICKGRSLGRYSTCTRQENDIFSGIVTVGWMSLLTFDKPIWYIVEVKQVDEDRVADPQFFWFRPFVPMSE